MKIDTVVSAILYSRYDAAVAIDQRGHHQDQQLVSRIGPTWRISQVNVMVQQSARSQMIGQNDRQDEPASVTSQWSSKSVSMQSESWGGSIHWVLHVSGWFLV